MDKAFKQRALKVRKMPENSDQSHLLKRSQGVHAFFGNHEPAKTPANEGLS
jgi:hypothetical protein